MVCELICRRCNSGWCMTGYLPSARNAKLHYINRLGIHCWKWNVIIYIHNCFWVNYVIIFCQMVSALRGNPVLNMCHLKSPPPQWSYVALFVVLLELCVFPVEPQRPNGKNINLHKKWGFRRECQKVRRTALFWRKKCTKNNAQKVRFSALFAHFLALFLESAETPLFVQINVFAVWPLRLDRKYTILEGPKNPRKLK